MINYINGNLFDTTAPIIAHGCNCVGGFGSGVAGYIANHYPIVRNAYKDRFTTHGWKLGEIQVVTAYGKTFVNCATQQNCGSDPDTVYVSYDAIKECLEKVRDFADGSQIAIPKIGAGLANGDWNIIEDIINDVFINDIIQVYYL